jgi:hypothetical protein
MGRALTTVVRQKVHLRTRHNRADVSFIGGITADENTNKIQNFNEVVFEFA